MFTLPRLPIMPEKTWLATPAKNASCWSTGSFQYASCMRALPTLSPLRLMPPASTVCPVSFIMFCRKMGLTPMTPVIVVPGWPAS